MMWYVVSSKSPHSLHYDLSLMDSDIMQIRVYPEGSITVRSPINFLSRIPFILIAESVNVCDLTGAIDLLYHRPFIRVRYLRYWAFTRSRIVF